MREDRHWGSGSEPVVAAAILALLLGIAQAAGTDGLEARVAAGSAAPPCASLAAGDSEDGRRSRTAYEDTLWIFDADFEDLLGDNAGWTTSDGSGTLGYTNYWHKDTIRLTEPYLGDSTWWCGTVDTTGCWRQPRGYGNSWICILEREFPLSEWSDPGDDVVLEWDQRYAMEKRYDFGYVDISSDSGATWTTIISYTNYGWSGPGAGRDWDDGPYGHPVHHLGYDWAGVDILVRFRFESDIAYSSQDEYDNPQHSVVDGAWQLDNITLTVNGDTLFYDDCESGSMGWVHDDIPATGQAGVAFRRSYEDLWMDCGPSRHHEGWMMVAYDSLTGTTVDGEHAWLTTPAIDVAGAWKLVGQWEGCVHVRGSSNDYLFSRYASSGDPNCWEFVSMGWAWPGYDHAEWVTVDEDLDLFVGNDWFRMRWILGNGDPAPPGEPHGLGLALDRVRIGVPIGNATEFEPDTWNSFFDTFELAEALAETARVRIQDDDGIVGAFLIASSNGGETWSSYELSPEEPWSDWWLAPPPIDEIAPGTEIRYYFESIDDLGNVRTFPKGAPEATLEFSILPITGSIQDPAVLLVDKDGQYIPNEHRQFTNTSEDYFREALDLLGLEYDVYDVQVPSGSIHSEGPDSSGMKYYSTQIWFSSDFDAYTLWRRDQYHLIEWLTQAAEGKERNLLLTGNDIGKELVQSGRETLDFYSTWLASDFVADNFGATLDTMPTLRDAAGDFDFMTHDDRACLLWDDGYG